MCLPRPLPVGGWGLTVRGRPLMSRQRDPSLAPAPPHPTPGGLAGLLQSCPPDGSSAGFLTLSLFPPQRSPLNAGRLRIGFHRMPFESGAPRVALISLGRSASPGRQQAVTDGAQSRPTAWHASPFVQLASCFGDKPGTTCASLCPKHNLGPICFPEGRHMTAGGQLRFFPALLRQDAENPSY